MNICRQTPHGVPSVLFALWFLAPGWLLALLRPRHERRISCRGMSSSERGVITRRAPLSQDASDCEGSGEATAGSLDDAEAALKQVVVTPRARSWRCLLVAAGVVATVLAFNLWGMPMVGHSSGNAQVLSSPEPYFSPSPTPPNKSRHARTRPLTAYYRS